MFDIIFDGFFALNQAAMLLGALVLLTLGLAIAADSLRWRLKALRATGTIIGVRRKPGMKRGEIYYPVYNVISENGEMFEATSDTGSSSTEGKATGRVVPLLYLAGNKMDVRAANSYISLILSIIFTGPGAFLFYHGWNMHPLSWMTVVIMIALIATGATKIKKNIIPKAQRLSPTAWKAARLERRAAKREKMPVERIEDILGSPEKKEEAKENRKNSRIAAPIMIVIGLGLAGLGIHLGQELQTLLDHGLRSPGKVVELEASTDSEGTTYYAIVSFRPKSGGRKIRFRDSMGSNPPAYSRGEKVTVLYLTDDMEDSAIIDRKHWNWLPSGLCLLIGVLLSFAGIKIFLNTRTGAQSL